MDKLEKFPNYWNNKRLDPYDAHKEKAAANKRIRDRVKKITRYIVRSTEFQGVVGVGHNYIYYNIEKGSALVDLYAKRK